MNEQFLPLISILIPAYNHENYVQKTLKSLISQDYQNLELIILNDGSTDHTGQRIRDILPECHDRFQRVELVDKNNSGLSKTLNQGLSLVNGKYIFHLASDDMVEPDAISSLFKIIEKDENIAVVCGDADFINDKDECIRHKNNGVSYNSFIKMHTSEKKDFSQERDFGSYKTLLTGNYIPIGLLVRASVYEDVGNYSEQLMLEDWDFWLRVAKKYKILLLNKITAHYRIHITNTATVYHKRLVADSISILANEYSYCNDSNLINEWRLIMFAYLKETDDLNSINNHKLLNILKKELLYFVSASESSNFFWINKILKIINLMRNTKQSLKLKFINLQIKK